MTDRTPPQTPGSTPSADAHALPDDSKRLTGIDAFIARIDRWHAMILGAGVLLAGATQLEVSVEKQWPLVIFTAVVALVAAAVYIVADRRHRASGRSFAFVVRFAAYAILLCIVPLTSGVFFALTTVVRLHEDGPIMAIARFEGPPLPQPYQDCRPSDMLADKLSDVQDRFHHLTAFELPYVVDPNGRWAESFASLHGVLEGADVVVYGEYSLVDSGLGNQQPDRILITPNVNHVPAISLGWKTSPLLEWKFPTRVVNISELCTGTSERFLNDGHRLGLAVAGLQLFAHQQYVGAEAARDEAESPSSTTQALLKTAAPAQSEATCDQTTPPFTSECSGVLAFYLAVLDQRLGNNERAKHEYAYAAHMLHLPAPYINLGELYLVEADGKKALAAFRSAVSAEPRSVSALAALSQCEYQYGNKDLATIELARAFTLHKTGDDPKSGYDTVALSRALFAREDRSSRQRGFAIMEQAIATGHLPPQLRIDAKVDYGRWLASQADADSNAARQMPGSEQARILDADAGASIDKAIAAFGEVIAERPMHIKANYQYGLALAVKRRLSQQTSHGEDQMDHDRIAQHFLTALDARAFTDDEFTDQGNAAFELGEIHKARRLYAQAISINQRAVYAFQNRGRLYLRTKQYAFAARDSRFALNLHPRERALRDQANLVAMLQGHPQSSGPAARQRSDLVSSARVSSRN